MRYVRSLLYKLLTVDCNVFFSDFFVIMMILALSMSCLDVRLYVVGPSLLSPLLTHQVRTAVDNTAHASTVSQHCMACQTYASNT